MRVLKRVGVVVGVLGLLVGGLLLWAESETRARLGRTVPTHSVSFPIPFPPRATPGMTQPGAKRRAPAGAGRHAIERGRHLVESRYGCVGCHGDDLGGGVMVDEPLFGRVLAPNLTRGLGSRTLAYRAADWDRIVRHGVKPDGRPALMPSGGYVRMSDRELSDIVMYIRSLPAISNRVPAVTLGPFAWLAIASGEFPVAALDIADHHTDHRSLPPEAAPTAAFGRHLAAVCTGCHRPSMEGGPIRTGPPTWPPAGNLTPHPSGLQTWTFAQFDTALRKGLRPDGTELAPPMSQMLPYGRRMTETEMRALWAFLRQLAPKPTGT